MMLELLLGELQGSMSRAGPSPELVRPHVAEAAAARPRWTAGQALTDIYSSEYNSLVRMAASLVSDIPTAEEVVQDSFVATQVAWPHLHTSDKALAYVRQSVMNRARSVLRRRMVADRHSPRPGPDVPSAEHSAIAEVERSAVISALRMLPARQREALMLRFYLNLREGQIASVMGISRGSVKTHTARAMTTLRGLLAPSP
jgi:RNA polymerase sigma-70 factor (sigma-E family)